jgi:hypothetical protein
MSDIDWSFYVRYYARYSDTEFSQISRVTTKNGSRFLHLARKHCIDYQNPTGEDTVKRILSLNGGKMVSDDPFDCDDLLRLVNTKGVVTGYPCWRCIECYPHDDNDDECEFNKTWMGTINYRYNMPTNAALLCIRNGKYDTRYVTALALLNAASRGPAFNRNALQGIAVELVKNMSEHGNIDSFLALWDFVQRQGIETTKRYMNKERRLHEQSEVKEPTTCVVNIDPSGNPTFSWGLSFR